MSKAAELEKDHTTGGTTEGVCARLGRNDVFHDGIVEHEIKDLCRVYVSKSVNCAYCGNQRSRGAARAGLIEDDYKQLLDFESAYRYDGLQKAALSLAEAITWDRETDDAFWKRLRQLFTDPQLVELGYFIGFTMGQQRFHFLMYLLTNPAGSMCSGSTLNTRYRNDPSIWLK